MSPPGSPLAPAPAMPLGMVRIARRNLQVEEDLFSETCRGDYYCIRCQTAFCSHCCGCHHIHLTGGASLVVKVDLDAGGRPVFPTHTEGHRIQRWIMDAMAAHDYTSRLARDAFCLHCGTAFCAAVCSHHDDHSGEGLPDAVVRVVDRGGGQSCVRCVETEWWTSLMDEALGDPVEVGEDEQGNYYELLPVLRCSPGTCMRCGGGVPWQPIPFCSDACEESSCRETEERRRRREARHAARGIDSLRIR